MGKALLIVIVFLFLMNFHFLLFLNIKEFPNINQVDKNETSSHHHGHLECASELGTWYSNFMDKTWFWVDIFVYFVIPFLTMCITFSIIKFKLKSINRNYATILLDNTYNNYNKSIYLRKIKRNNKIIHFLLGTNTYFCLSIVPFIFFSLFKSMNKYLSERDIYYVRFLVEILFYSNNALNIFFYGFTSKEFRKALKRVFCMNNRTNKKKMKKSSRSRSDYIFCKKIV